MKITRIGIDDVIVMPGRRPLDENGVHALMQSLQNIGLQQPITVRYVDTLQHPTEGEIVSAYVLVSGGHRLEAAKRLNWPEVPCVVVRGSDVDARLIEIAENLHRAELTTIERSEQVAEWIELTEEKAVSAQLEPKLSARGRDGEGRPESGIKAAARELAIDRNEAQRAVKIAGITDEAKEAARAAGLDDNQSVLLKIARAEPERQKEAVAAIVEERAAKREAKPNRPQPAPVHEEPIPTPKPAEPISIVSAIEAQQRQEIMTMWRTMQPAVRRWFLSQALDEITA